MTSYFQSFYFNVDDTFQLRLRNRDKHFRFRFKVFAVGPGENGDQRVQASGNGLGSIAFDWDPSEPSQWVRVGRYNYHVTYEGKEHANAT